jgi:hypothetical protein
MHMPLEERRPNSGGGNNVSGKMLRNVVERGFTDRDVGIACRRS